MRDIHPVKFRPYHKEVVTMLYLMRTRTKSTIEKKPKISRNEKRAIRKLVHQNRKDHTLILTIPECIAIVVRSLRHRTFTLHLYH